MTDTSQPQTPAHGSHTGAAHVQAAEGVLVSADAAQVITFWLGQYAKLCAERNGAVPNGLPELQRALAESAAGSRQRECGAGVELPALPFVHEAELTTDEAAEQLGITPDAVRWHCRRQNLASRRVGRSFVIPASAVEEFARERRLA